MLPIYGNKVIATYNGVTDFHGIPRHPTWSQLETTALPGDNKITIFEPVDWKAGEEIVIAPSGYYNREAEQFTIVDVDNTDPSKPVITLNSTLQAKHYAGIQWFDDQFIEMRAEVGLLTRNILFQGDPETSLVNQFGAHMIIHADGSETVIGRIEYVEFFNVGQAFQLGRYPIHFHLIGSVTQSYIRGNAIHQ